MNRRNPDRISMLVDNELAEWELKGTIHALGQDSDLKACWRNYHLIGDAMRGHLPNYLCLDLSDRVTQALEHEPLYLQPRTQPQPSTTTHMTPRTRTAVGFALAASLSVVAVVGVMDIGQTEAPGGAAMVASTAEPPAAATAPETPRFMYTFTADASTMPAGGVIPSTAARTEAREVPGVHTVAVSHGLPLANDLTEYLMNYQRFYATHHDKEDTLSYLRLVGYGE